MGMLLDHIPAEARAEIEAVKEELDGKDLDFRWASSWVRTTAAILVWATRQIMAGRKST